MRVYVEGHISILLHVLLCCLTLLQCKWFNILGLQREPHSQLLLAKEEADFRTWSYPFSNHLPPPSWVVGSGPRCWVVCPCGHQVFSAHTRCQTWNTRHLCVAVTPRSHLPIYPLASQAQDWLFKVQVLLMVFPGQAEICLLEEENEVNHCDKQNQERRASVWIVLMTVAFISPRQTSGGGGQGLSFSCWGFLGHFKSCHPHLVRGGRGNFLFRMGWGLWEDLCVRPSVMQRQQERDWESIPSPRV